MEMVKILNCVEIINDSVSYFEGERKFLSTGDLNISEIINLENVTFENKPSRANLNVKSGDIILARMQGTTKVRIIENLESDIIVSTGFIVLRPKSNIDKRFLYHTLLSKDLQNEKDSFCTGATQKAINNANFSKIKIPLPSLSVQKQIAARLDKAQEIIRYNEEMIAKYDQLTQSLFLDMFGDPVKNEMGWEKVELGEISKIRIGPFGSLLHLEDYIVGGTPLVNPSHIKDGKIIIDENLTVGKDKLQELIPYLLSENDVVLGRRGEMGRCAIVTEKEKGFLCGTGSIFIRPEKSISSLFLYKILSSNSFKIILENEAKGITMKNLNSKIVSDLKIPLPPISLQNQFAERIQKIEAQKQAAQEELTKSEELFQSLLQQSF